MKTLEQIREDIKKIPVSQAKRHVKIKELLFEIVNVLEERGIKCDNPLVEIVNVKDYGAKELKIVDENPPKPAGLSPELEAILKGGKKNEPSGK